MGKSKFANDAKSNAQLAASLAQIVTNVKSFGAKGDGVTNDTNSIQSLIDSLSLQGGGTVFFPKGTYIAYLKVPSNIKLLGVGYDSCIKLPPNMTNPTPVIINADKVNGNQNINIENIRIDGNRTSINVNAPKGIGYPWEGINLILVNNLTVKNVWIENCENEGLDFDGGKTILIDGLFVTNVGGSPLHPSNGQGDLTNRDVIIRNVWSTNNGHTHSRSVFLYGSDNLILDGYYSDSDYRGLQILGQNMKVSNVTVKNPTENGILVSGTSDNIKIENVDVDSAGAIGVVVSANNISLSNIRIKSSVSNGINLEGNNIQANNCVVENSGAYGVLIVGDDMNLSNVKAIGSTNRGYNITGNRITINGLVAKNGVIHGVNLNNSSNVVISGSEICNNQGYGITINGTASNYAINGNNLSNNTSGAIYGTRTGHLIENNIGDFNKKYGSVTIPTGSTSATVTHGMGAIPNFVSLMLTPSESNLTKWEVGSRTSTTFLINVSPAPTTNVTILWKVE